MKTQFTFERELAVEGGADEKGQKMQENLIRGQNATTKFWQIFKYLISYFHNLSYYKSSQNTYGIKNGHYLRYRIYCTRKIDKLRININFKYGNSTKFNKKDVVEQKGNDKRALQIIGLMQTNKS